MRVLQINSVCGIGSTGRIATDIHNMLIKQGHESYIAYGRDLPINCDNAIRIGTKLDNYGHVAMTRILDKHGFGSKKATIEFIEKIKNLDPDVIHLHNIHGYYINIEVLFDYLKVANKPVVWTLHDCWSFTGHCSHFDYIGCKKWKSACFDCVQMKEYPKSIIFDKSGWNYEKKKKIFTGVKNLTIVTPSNWLADLVKKSFLKEYNVKVINNGIDLEVFKPIENNFRELMGINSKFIILGVASVWNEKKGLKYFLELSNMVDEDDVIVLVGLTEKQKENLPKNVIGITKTNSINELAKIYSSADVFVNLTLEEVLGMTNIEAMACGIPVITFNTGGSVECIDQNSGYIVEKGNTEELIHHIKTIKRSSNSFYSNHCTKRAHMYFNKKEKFIEYFNIYNK